MERVAVGGARGAWRLTARARPFAATLTLLLALAACGGAGGDGSAAGGAAEGGSPPADASGQPVALSDADCTPLGTPASGQGGAYSAFQCLPDGDRNGGVVRLRFTLEGSGGQSSADYTLDAADYAALTSRPEPRLWSGHILTLDLAGTRSGRLIIANRTDAGFVLSTYDYHVDGDRPLELSWSGDGLIADTRTDGRVRLLPATGATATPGTFEPEWLGCLETGVDSVTQSLRLPVDVTGRILAISYMSATQAPDGTPLVCSVEHGRLDGQSRWTDDGASGTTIAMSADDGGSPDEILISRQGARYNVEFRVRPWVYCGPSAVIAHAIQFDAGSRDCALVELAANVATPARGTRVVAE